MQKTISEVELATSRTKTLTEFIERLLQSHISFGLINTKQLSKFKTKGLGGCLYLGADTIIWVDTSRHYVSLICFFF